MVDPRPNTNPRSLDDPKMSDFKVTLVFLSLFLFLVGVIIWAGKTDAAPAQPKVGVFATLEKGQKVSLKETAHGLEIGIVQVGNVVPELGYTVQEVGQDYIVLDDVSGVHEVRIPICAVKTVKTIRFKK